MDASAWWQAESISAVRAAMILCCINPNTETSADAEMSLIDGELVAGGTYRRLKGVFEGAADQTKTLKEWAEYADSMELKTHSWFREWMSAKTASTPEFFKHSSGSGSTMVAKECQVPAHTQGRERWANLQMRHQQNITTGMKVKDSHAALAKEEGCGIDNIKRMLKSAMKDSKSPGNATKKSLSLFDSPLYRGK